MSDTSSEFDFLSDFLEILLLRLTSLPIAEEVSSEKIYEKKTGSSNLGRRVLVTNELTYSILFNICMNYKLLSTQICILYMVMRLAMHWKQKGYMKTDLPIALFQIRRQFNDLANV